MVTRGEMFELTYLPSLAPSLPQVLHTCTQRRHTACWPVVYTTSSKTGEGVQELRECLAGVVYNE